MRSDLVRRLIRGSGVLIFNLLSVSATAQVLVVPAGTTAAVAPGDADCITELDVRNDSNVAIKVQSCDGDRLRTQLSALPTQLPNTVDITAWTRFAKQFRVDTPPGAQSSFLPVSIAVPVRWRGALFNDSAVPAANFLDPVGAHADVNMRLNLVASSPGAPATRTRTLSSQPIMGASHAGIAGCLTVPGSLVEAGEAMVKCLVQVQQREQGGGTFFVSSVIETGKTYNVELEMITELFTFNSGQFAGSVTLGGHPDANFSSNLVGEPAGLTWANDLYISVGTDAGGEIQGLVDEMAKLRSEVDLLRQQFLTHTHGYLTGAGIGHNNVTAGTSRPNVP